MQDRIHQVDETSCTARPDHTVGSKAVLTAPKSDFRSSPNNGHHASERPLPKSAINGSSAFLFNDLVRAGEKGRRDFDTKRFPRLEIDGLTLLVTQRRGRRVARS
jgi:hypothetical protein